MKESPMTCPEMLIIIRSASLRFTWLWLRSLRFHYVVRCRERSIMCLMWFHPWISSWIDLNRMSLIDGSPSRSHVRVQGFGCWHSRLISDTVWLATMGCWPHFGHDRCIKKICLESLKPAAWWWVACHVSALLPHNSWKWNHRRSDSMGPWPSSFAQDPDWTPPMLGLSLPDRVFRVESLAQQAARLPTRAGVILRQGSDACPSLWRLSRNTNLITSSNS